VHSHLLKMAKRCTVNSKRRETGLDEVLADWLRRLDASEQVDHLLCRSRLERAQQFVEVDDGDARGGVAHSIGKDEDCLVNHPAARVHDVWDITDAFAPGGDEKGFGGLTDQPAGVVMVQQSCANAVLAHWAYAVRQEQPAGIGFKR
jgi:hypothetical protein